MTTSSALVGSYRYTPRSVAIHSNPDEAWVRNRTFPSIRTGSPSGLSVVGLIGITALVVATHTSGRLVSITMSCSSSLGKTVASVLRRLTPSHRNNSVEAAIQSAPSGATIRLRTMISGGNWLSGRNWTPSNSETPREVPTQRCLRAISGAMAYTSLSVRPRLVSNPTKLKTS